MRALRVAKPAIPEKEILRACLEYLTYHPAVAFAFRVNSGAVKATYKGKGRYIRYNSMPGVSDILGMTKTGRFIAIECKRAGSKPTAEQQSFLDAVAASGGIAVVAYGSGGCCGDAAKVLTRDPSPMAENRRNRSQLGTRKE